MELQIALEYKEWRNFDKVIDKAKIACKGSKISILDHFVDVNKTIPLLAISSSISLNH